MEAGRLVLAIFRGLSSTFWLTRPADTGNVLDPHVPLVRIIRDFAASPSKVFRAHVEPDLVARCNCPNGTAMRVDHWDW